MIKKLSKISLSVILSLSLVMSGCSRADGPLTSKEAKEELSAYLSKIKVTDVEPVMDINSSDDEVSQLADISEYPLVVDGGNAEIVIEIAASTEKSTAKSGSNPYDDLYIYAAEQFNSGDFEVNGKSVGISIRKITSGDVLTYVSEAGYKPEAYSPSNTLWAEMIESMGYSVELIEEKTAGNTAGILMKKSVYDKYNKSHGDVTIGGVIDAAMANELSFAYVNPYTSSTGLNCFTQMLKMFDPSNPLSDTARQNALAYQDTAPAVAFTTAEMRKSAQNGLVDVMAMERQAYINFGDLSEYVYTPMGVRHDSPLYAFSDWCNDEQLEGLELFGDFVTDSDMQNEANKRGFNRSEDNGYTSVDSGLSGHSLVEAQLLWKDTKDGGRPVIGVFVCDISGSMLGEPLETLKSSVINASKYISSDNYFGVVSYNDKVYCNLPIGKMDAAQRAKLKGSVNALSENGTTATWDATLVALDMLLKKQKEIPDAKLMLFVMSDGETNEGVKIDKLEEIMSAFDVPIYTVMFNGENDDMKRVAELNEGSAINAVGDNLSNKLRELFNVQM